MTRQLILVGIWMSCVSLVSIAAGLVAHKLGVGEVGVAVVAGNTGAIVTYVIALIGEA